MINKPAAMMLSLLIIAALGALPAKGIAQEAYGKIIDTHAHLAPDAQKGFERALKVAIATMDQFGIETSIVMSPPRPPNARGNYDSDDFRAALSRYPGRFRFMAGGGTLNPRLHNHPEPSQVGVALRDSFSAEARRLIDGGAAGFGEMSSLHVSLTERHGYTYVPADHPLLLVLADVAAEHGVPIDLHMDVAAEERRTIGRLAGLPNNPKLLPATVPALERLLAHTRRATIIWAHAGTDHLGDFTPERISALLDKHTNLFVSLKIAGPKAPTKNKVFAGRSLDPEWRALLMRHLDRFVIGTDNFYADPSAGGPMAEFSRVTGPRLRATKMFLSMLPPILARQIARDNALRLYGMSGP